MAEHTKEAGHWYDREGNPRYTIIGKNGKERNTTLRDARKEGFLPSVTSIIRCAAAPGLENWKAQQVLMAALTTDRMPDETEQQYIDRIIKDSQEQSLKARERGTEIHAIVQQGFESEDCLDPYYKTARQTLDETCGTITWLCETPFATESYGGKIDLWDGKNWVVDIKTTDKDLTNIKTWDEHAMQLAAYSCGVCGVMLNCGILYINIKTAESKLIQINKQDLEQGWEMFNALLDYYYAKTGLGG